MPSTLPFKTSYQTARQRAWSVHDGSRATGPYRSTGNRVLKDCKWWARAARLLSTNPVTVRGLNYVPSAWHLVLHEHIDFEGAVLYVEARRGRRVTVMMWPLQESGSG